MRCFFKQFKINSIGGEDLSVGRIVLTKKHTKNMIPLVNAYFLGLPFCQSPSL